MLRPHHRLSEPTRQRLDAAVRAGARETWVDRSDLGLVEPSAMWRWLCVLEFLGPRGSAVGCSGDDSESGPELAAREALARFDEIVRAHPRADRGGHSSPPSFVRAPGNVEGSAP
jgi:hypothetical protein